MIPTALLGNIIFEALIVLFPTDHCKAAAKSGKCFIAAATHTTYILHSSYALQVLPKVTQKPTKFSQIIHLYP